MHCRYLTKMLFQDIIVYFMFLHSCTLFKHRTSVFIETLQNVEYYKKRIFLIIEFVTENFYPWHLSFYFIESFVLESSSFCWLVLTASLKSNGTKEGVRLDQSKVNRAVESGLVRILAIWSLLDTRDFESLGSYFITNKVVVDINIFDIGM